MGIDVGLQLHGDDRVETHRHQRPIELDLIGGHTEEAGRAVSQEIDNVSEGHRGRDRRRVHTMRRGVMPGGVAVGRGDSRRPVRRGMMPVGLEDRDRGLGGAARAVGSR